MSFIAKYIGSMLFWFLSTLSMLLLIFRKRIRNKSDVLKILIFAYIVVICSQTLFPSFDFGIDSASGMPYFNMHFRRDYMKGINLIPFKTVYLGLKEIIESQGAKDSIILWIANFAGNIFLFIPLGMLLPSAKNIEYRHVLTFVLVFSGSIEFIQYYIGRSTDIDDVILNTLGSFIGYGVYKLIKKLDRHR